jgi:hypothetical protein
MRQKFAGGFFTQILPCIKRRAARKIILKGAIDMLTEKELMQLGDYLKQAQATSETMTNFVGLLQDEQSKQVLQQIAQKNVQNAQNLSRHLNGGQAI